MSIELISSFSGALLLMTCALGILAFKMDRELTRLKKRARALNERLDALEAYNGLYATNTDIRVIK